MYAHGQSHPGIGLPASSINPLTIARVCSPRLSRPALAHSYALPQPTEPTSLSLSPQASLPHPSADVNDPFIISPLLKLPEAFGSAYVGETFSCTLCANNELQPGDDTKSVSGVRVTADMQTPSAPNGISLELEPREEDETAAGGVLDVGKSLQKILTFELREEGSHTLAVTVTYTETQLGGEGQAAGGRVRTFRKLYQFVAQQLITVKTKISELPAKGGGLSKFVLEAQLENSGEGSLSLEVTSPTGQAQKQHGLRSRRQKLMYHCVAARHHQRRVAVQVVVAQHATQRVARRSPTPARAGLRRCVAGGVSPGTATRRAGRIYSTGGKGDGETDAGPKPVCAMAQPSRRARLSEDWTAVHSDAVKWLMVKKPCRDDDEKSAKMLLRLFCREGGWVNSA